MKVAKSHQDRERLYRFGIGKLGNTSPENIKMLENHLFHLKMNEDYVINSFEEVSELVQFLNNNNE
ncbi:hypothetical protein BZG02_00200 [Labilibaculum filiforme]|uniref:Uncharacterized protein n=1 Tax=Labilibaculum filiforme TaxID=1940526 RepID=A0A2N3I577_9BACT|nr:hypothetical protein [Labilibaculum filiforme]PKQ65464.1 hypothetical protein BZG02_00200 [Labilibaculum filiforme]